MSHQTSALPIAYVFLRILVVINWLSGAAASSCSSVSLTVRPPVLRPLVRGAAIPGGDLQVGSAPLRASFQF